MRPGKNLANNQHYTAYLLGGFIAGIVGTILCNMYLVIFESITEESYEELNFVSISLVTIITSLIGSLVYLWMHKKIRGASTLFVVVGLLVAFVSLVPTVIAPPDFADNFINAVAPMHILAALSCVIIVPLFVERSRSL